jgi:hypothetical protein
VRSPIAKSILLAARRRQGSRYLSARIPTTSNARYADGFLALHRDGSAERLAQFLHRLNQSTRPP